jgi:hypothetical protein
LSHFLEMAHAKNNSIVVRIQRNVFSKISQPGLVRHVISDSYVQLLDIIYSILNQYYSEEIAEKVDTNFILTINNHLGRQKDCKNGC